MTTKHAALPWLMLATGIVLISREAVFFLGFYILGSSIDWPASLGLPAKQIFALMRDNGPEMFGGYYVYMISSAMFIPIAVLLRWLVAGEDTATTLLADIAVCFAVASSVFRLLGILRWLFAMPVLSRTYFDPASSDTLREVALLNYEMLNGYAGQVGEHLGLSFTGAAFLAFFAAAFFRSSRVPTVFAVWAAIAAVLFIPIADLMGFDGGFLLMINGTTYSVWAMVFGAYLILGARKKALATQPD